MKKFFKKVFVYFSVLAIVVQSLSPLAYLQLTSKAYAQTATNDATSVSPTPTPTDTPSPTPTDTAIPTPTDTPVPTDTASPTPTPVPTDTASPTPTPVDNLSPPPSSTPTDNPSPSAGQVQGDSASPTPSPTATPTPTPEPATGNEQLNLIVLKNVFAPSLDLQAVNTYGSATLTTDKADYAPTDTALITGTGYNPNETYTLLITSVNNYSFSTTVAADSSGNIAYAYQLDGTYRPTYTVQAIDSTGKVVATITFTDAPLPSDTKLNQWKTVPSGSWTTGSLNSSNSNYTEGETVPFELDIGKIATSGNPYTFSVCRDYQSGSHFGYISLQLYNTSRPAVADGSISTTNTPFSGSNISSISSTEVGGQGACGAGQRETQVSITVTSGSADTYLLWGGRLASPTDPGVGAGNGASSYPGGSLHMHLLSPNKDVGIQTSGIIQLAQITVTKTVDSGSANPNQWCFTISPDPNSQSGTICGPSGIFTGLPTGSYTITESSVNGYSFASGTGTNCTFNGSTATASVATGTTATNGTCNFHNAQQTGSITIVKDAVPNDAQDFSFIAGGGLSPTTFSLDDDSDPTLSNTKVFSNLSAGTYSVSEAGVTGWTSDGGVCNDESPVSAISLQAGENVTCTFTNTKDATLKLVKAVTNDNGGTNVPHDWTLTATGTGGFSDTGDSTTFHTVNIGVNYTLTESSISGYTAGTWSCDSGTQSTNHIQLSAGQAVTCTINNNDTPAHLIVIKHVVNDNGGTKVAGDFSTTISGVTTANPTAAGAESPGVDNVLTSVGSYTVDEGAHGGYDKTLSADCSGTIALGETKTCTITNNDNPPSLTLVKVVSNTHGGNAVATDWTLTATGPTIISGAGGTTSDSSFAAGTYTLSESTGPSGYSAGDWSCVKNNGAPVTGHSITLANGDNATCTITNFDQTATITLIKEVINDNGGTAGPNDFGISVGGFTVVSGQVTNVDSNKAYAIDETGHTGYDFVSLTGDAKCPSVLGGIVTLNEGESITCTIKNDDSTPQLHLRKTITNDNGGGATLANFTLTANGTGANDISGTSPVDSDSTLKADTFALSETNVSGYTASSWVCVGGTQNGSNITLGLGESATCTITNNDIAPTLKLVKSVRGGSSTAHDWTLSAQSNGSGGFSDFGDSNTFHDVVANTSYALSELGPSSYTASDWSCDNGITPSNSAITLPLGKNVTCTITNTRDTGTITVNKVLVPSNDTGKFDLRIDGNTAGTGGNVGNGGTTGAITVDTGNHNVSEAGVATNLSDYNEVITGDCAADGTVNVAKGQNAVCTITNTRLGTIIVKKVMGGSTDSFDFTGDVFGTISSNNGTLTTSDVLPGTYTSVEGAVTGWDLNSIVCDDGQSQNVSTGDTGTKTATFKVDPGETVTCTFTNTKRGAITIVKNTTGGNDTFSFTSNFGISSLTTSGGTTSQTVDNLVPGSDYNISETVPTGWDLNSAICTNGTIDSITVVAGQTTTCTFTNTKRPTLSVWKYCNPPGDTGKFNLFIDRTQETSDTVCGGWTNGQIEVTIGSHTVGETGGSGTNLSNYTSVIGGECASDGSITLAAGENKSCTITNTRKGHLIVQKTTVPGGDQTAFTINASGTGIITGGGGGSVTDATDNDYEVTPGTYSVAETVPDGWSKTGDTCQNVEVAAGATVNCLLTNTKLANLIIVKDTVGGDGAFDFTTTGSGISDFSLTTSGGTDSKSFTNINPGTYSVSESPIPDGWELSSATCSNEDNPVSSINISAGQTVTCTFTNTKLGNLVIVKNTVGGDGTFDFTTTDNGLSDFSLTTVSGTKEKTFNNITPGSYSISETSQDGWDLTSATCDNENEDDPSDVTVNAGETVTCTFTNTKRGKIIVTKYNDPEGEGIFNPDGQVLSGWTINLSGQDSQTTGSNGQVTFDNLVPNEYLLSENPQGGWDQTNIFCDEGTKTSRGESKHDLSVYLSAGQTANCSILNHNKIPILTIAKTNDASGNKAPGDTVGFTITVAADETGGPADNVKVTDLLPKGFHYNSGSWSANSSIHGVLSLSEPTYASPGVWTIGYMDSNETITLKYTATIDGSQQTGTYYDNAWAQGTAVSDPAVILASADPDAADGNIGDANFVGTQVAIVNNNQAGVDYKATSTQSVLGASTGPELPSTGENTLWVIIATLMFALGAGTIIMGYRLRTKYAR